VVARLTATGGTHCDGPMRLSSEFQYFLLYPAETGATPLRRGHPATDQKVGGSNPSERAKVLVTGLQISVRFWARRNLAQGGTAQSDAGATPRPRAVLVHCPLSSLPSSDESSSVVVHHSRVGMKRAINSRGDSGTAPNTTYRHHLCGCSKARGCRDIEVGAVCLWWPRPP
jgi:hypothetical protein